MSPSCNSASCIGDDEPVSPPTSTRSHEASIDAVLRDGEPTARAAAVELGGNTVGDHLGVVAEAESDRVVTHRFTSAARGYGGWQWSVTLARAPRSKKITVDEVVLLPGDGALLAPAWVPWSERIMPGDLSVSDVLPTEADDLRLVPSYLGSDDPAAEDPGVEPILFELGVGRIRVLSREGRTEAADRWHTGEHGPATPMARHAPGECASCGYFLPIAGSMRQLFGACANVLAPADGHVVSADFGCGGHSEAVIEPAPPEAGPSYNTADFDILPVD
ncbi:MAG: DUF3027 domain-containing protein [Geodermatophilaceae bacterium]|nr:DUF3027 domain-containing protein [Geodermatophilaceae bacterium]